MFHIESGTDGTIVRVRREIDFSVKADFLEVLLLASNNASGPLVVSLEDCRFMDCAGLSVLLKVRKVARVPMSVILLGDSFLWRFFSIAGLLKRLNATEGGAAAAAA